ncbi:MAG: hydrogenase small subunit [Firmicutes bacterium]|jgi:hydrogenase small subunit|nr:hydrogenase small subunit [Bacillota bacterium]
MLTKQPKLPVIWIEALSCTGDTISFENATSPTMEEIMKYLVDFRYHYILMAAGGNTAMQVMYDLYTREAGNYILIVEGAIPVGNTEGFTVVGTQRGLLGPAARREPLTAYQAIKHLGERARYVMAVGDCAAWGGPSAAYPNPAGCVGVQKVLPKRRVINVPGCPIHPDWAVGTLAHLLLYGMPELDADGRPTDFFGRTIHNLCTRRQYFENGIFARHLGDEGCLYRLGCKGPVTFADCPIRQWNSGHNWPVEDNTPCIGCTTPGFPDEMEPFFEHLPDIRLPGVITTANRVARAAGLATGVGIGAHLALTWGSGRLAETLKRGLPKVAPRGTKTLPGKVLAALRLKRHAWYPDKKGTWQE